LNLALTSPDILDKVGQEVGGQSRQKDSKKRHFWFTWIGSSVQGYFASLEPQCNISELVGPAFGLCSSRRYYSSRLLNVDGKVRVSFFESLATHQTIPEPVSTPFERSGSCRYYSRCP